MHTELERGCAVADGDPAAAVEEEQRIALMID
jgi:hypothetical protein